MFAMEHVVWRMTLSRMNLQQSEGPSRGTGPPSVSAPNKSRKKGLGRDEKAPSQPRYERAACPFPETYLEAFK